MTLVNAEEGKEYIIQNIDTDDEEILSKDIEETLKVVIETFAKVFEVETKEINKDTHFLYDLSGSSIQYFSLLTELSQETQVEISYDSESPLATPLDFAKYIVENK